MPEPKEDFLDEDVEIPSQRYVLLSFLSPEKVLARKDIFMFEKFLKHYEVNWRLKNLELFLVKMANKVNTLLEDRAAELEKKDQANAAALTAAAAAAAAAASTDASGSAATDASGTAPLASPAPPAPPAPSLLDVAELCRKSRVGVTGLLEEYQEFVKSNKNDVNKTKIVEEWDNFMYVNRAKLEEEYHAENNFRTTVRGVKVRGVFGSSQEADARSKKLQKADQHHNIFVGQVGKWLAWDPEPSQIENTEYAEEQLNDLMKSYKKNEESRDDFYKERGGKPKKSVVTMDVTGDSTESSVASANIFESVGDLAFQRKLNKE